MPLVQGYALNPNIIAAPKTYALLAPKVPADETWSRTFQVQGWTTIRGDASATFPVRSITQDEGTWLDLSTYADAAFWVDVCGSTPPSPGLVSLTLESSPVRDENYFRPIMPPLALIPQAVNGEVIPYLMRTIRTPATVPLTRYTRWRLSVPGGATGKWDATFRIRGAGGRSSFVAPNQLTGCIGWFRGDLGVTLSSGNVTVWADQSGRGHDATAPTNREPAYNVSGHQINGQPTLYFNPTGASGTEKILELTPGAFNIFDPVHAFVVHRRVSATETIAVRTGFWHIGRSTTGGETMPGTDGFLRDDCGSSVSYNTGVPIPSVPLNTPHVYEVRAKVGSWANFLNGKPQGSSATNPLDYYTPAGLGGNLLLNNFYYGDWAEAIFYNRILSNNERVLIVNYLNGRYGLTAQ
ncbi:hypothetical protein BH09MYX1_BH09MYX1_54850 [soil metagenome]